MAGCRGGSGPLVALGGAVVVAAGELGVGALLVAGRAREVVVPAVVTGAGPVVALGPPPGVGTVVPAGIGAAGGVDRGSGVVVSGDLPGGATLGGGVGAPTCARRCTSCSWRSSNAWRPSPEATAGRFRTALSSAALASAGVPDASAASAWASSALTAAAACTDRARSANIVCVTPHSGSPGPDPWAAYPIPADAMANAAAAPAPV